MAAAISEDMADPNWEQDLMAEPNLGSNSYI